MENITTQHIHDTIVDVYARKKGRLKDATYGVVVYHNQAHYALCVAHTMEDRDDAEVWRGLPPEVAARRKATSIGQLLSKQYSSEIHIDVLQDLMAIRLPEYAGCAFATFESDVGLLRPALVACTYYDLINDELVTRVEGQAGMVERETPLYLRLSTQGKPWMSGLPVVARRQDDNDMWNLVGLYAGTAGERGGRSLQTNTAEHAHVVKIQNFLGRISK